MKASMQEQGRKALGIYIGCGGQPKLGASHIHRQPTDHGFGTSAFVDGPLAQSAFHKKAIEPILQAGAKDLEIGHPIPVEMGGIAPREPLFLLRPKTPDFIRKARVGDRRKG